LCPTYRYVSSGLHRPGKSNVRGAGRGAEAFQESDSEEEQPHAAAVNASTDFAASNMLDDAAAVAMLEQASLMACGVVGIQHCRRALLLSHFVVV